RVTGPRSTPCAQGARLDPVELVLAAAAAKTRDELSVVRMAAIRSPHLLARVPGAPHPDDWPAGVTLPGGLPRTADVPQLAVVRLRRITDRLCCAPTDPDDVT